MMEALTMARVEMEKARLRADRAEALLAEVIRAGNDMAICAQTTGGTAGRDARLVAAIDGWFQVNAAVSQDGSALARATVTRVVAEHVAGYRKMVAEAVNPSQRSIAEFQASAVDCLGRALNAEEVF